MKIGNFIVGSLLSIYCDRENELQNIRFTPQGSNLGKIKVENDVLTTRQSLKPALQARFKSRKSED
jgi:hypothetical protein